MPSCCETTTGASAFTGFCALGGPKLRSSRQDAAAELIVAENMHGVSVCRGSKMMSSCNASSAHLPHPLPLGSSVAGNIVIAALLFFSQ